MTVLGRLIKQPLALTGMTVILIVVLVAFLGGLIRPDATIHASQQNQKLSRLPPFSKVMQVKIRMNRQLEDQPIRKQLFMGGVETAYSFIPFDSYSLEGGKVTLSFNGDDQIIHLVNVFYAVDRLTLEALMSTIADQFHFITLENEQIEISTAALQERFESEAILKKRFILGTDLLGRDLLSRLMAGSAISLTIGITSVLISILLGLTIGILSGYFGGLLDRILLWVINLFWSIPAVLFVVLITMAMGMGMKALVVGISSVLWVEMAQVIRHSVRSIREKEYIKASRLLGLSHWTILTRHILPNISAPILVLAVSTFADAIILESGLSFLGIGVAPPQPSWGNMIRDSYGYIMASEGTYLVLVPTAALLIVVLAFVFVSNGLKKAWSFSLERDGRGRV